LEEEIKKTEGAINKLFQQLLPILRRLFAARKNFKVTINVNAGQKFRIEVVEYFDET
jgi:hypothetical protein